MTKIILTDELYLGKGLHKAAWIHPDNEQLCIKVPFSQNDAELKHELAYRKVRERRHLHSSALTAYYGTIMTNKGLGYIFERVVDIHEGKVFPCKTMQDLFFEESKRLKPDRDLLQHVLMDFKYHLFHDQILTNSTTPVNFLLQYIDNARYPRVRIIDNIGSSVLIPFVYYFDYFAMQHIRRYWQRFTERICREYSQLIERKWLSA